MAKQVTYRQGSARASLAVLLAALCAGCPRVQPAPANPPAKAQTLRVTQDRKDSSRLLRADAARAQAAGASALQIVGADFVSEGDRLGAFVELPDAACVLMLARGSASIGDVDLFAYEDDGSAIAVDESSDARPALLVCPPHPRRVYVTARVVSGAGMLGVGVQEVPPSAVAAVEQAVGTRGRSGGGETGALDAWPGLEAKLLAHRAGLGGRWEDVRRVTLPVTPRAATRVSVPVEPGRCVDVLVAPSEEVISLEVVAEDPEGRIVARARDRARDRSLLLCSEAPLDLSIAIRPRASHGLVALVASRSAIGASGALDPSERAEYVTEVRELSAARTGLEKALAGKGFAAATTVGTGAAKVGSRTALPVTLPAGCARLDVVAGKPLADVSAALWDEKGNMLAEARGGSGATLFACGPGGAARVDLSAMGHPGPFAVEMRKDHAAPASLVAHPMAAARLLGRLDAGGEHIAAAAATGAQVIVLDAAGRATLPLDVPPSGCVEVTAALDRGGSGLDLRLADAATNEGVVTRGRYVVTDRLCAGAGGVKGTAELRLLTGKGDALVLTRTVSARDP